MGRLKKYKTEEDRKEANRQKAKRYYWRNKEKIDAKNKERYRRKRINLPLSGK